MQAPAVIKTEVSVNSNNIKAQAPSAERSESFSTEFDKQLSSAETQQADVNNVKNQSKPAQAETLEQENLAEESGEKLPLEKSEAAKSAENPVEQQADTVDSELQPAIKVAEKAIDASAVTPLPSLAEDKMETAPVLDEVTAEQIELATELEPEKVISSAVAPQQPIAKPTVDVKTTEESKVTVADTEQLVIQSDEIALNDAPIAEQDSVEQVKQIAPQSEVETEAAPVTADVTATTAIKGQVNAETQLVNNKAQTEGIETAKKAVLVNQGQNSISNKADNPAAQQIETVKQTVMESQAVKQQTVTAVNDSEIKATDKPVSLRADIQEALNKQSKNLGSEIEATLKNKLTAQYQEGKTQDVVLAKTALVAQSELAQDKSTALFNQSPSARFSATTLTAATTMTSTATTAPSATASLDIQPSVQSAAWSKVMASRVVWMAKEGVQRAEIKLTPASMGSIEVKMTVQNEQASVSFQAQNAATREALEQSLPRLRESFADSGIQLADAEVGQQMDQQQQQDEQTGNESNIIFSQEAPDDDDIEIEGKLERDNHMGLSLYA